MQSPNRGYTAGSVPRCAPRGLREKLGEASIASAARTGLRHAGQDLREFTDEAGRARPRIVVLGAGFAGLNAARALRPTILNARDAIVKISSTAICGSDLHIYDGFIPTMRKGDILGHEFMGEVVETGSAVTTLKVGDRVVVPFPIACGHCGACERGLTSVCENSNPNAGIAETLWGHSPCGIFGYSHLLGGYPGGKRNTPGCPSPTSARSRSRTASRTSRCCSCPTSCPPATWAPTCVRSPPVTWSRCGARGRWVSSPSPALECWAPNG